MIEADDRRQRLDLDLDEVTRVLGHRARATPTTNAIGSPTYLTSSPASGWYGTRAPLTVVAFDNASQCGPASAARSDAGRTANTPGSASAALMSTARIRPRATWLRRNAPWVRPATTTSSV